MESSLNDLTKYTYLKALSKFCLSEPSTYLSVIQRLGFIVFSEAEIFGPKKFLIEELINSEHIQFDDTILSSDGVYPSDFLTSLNNWEAFSELFYPVVHISGRKKLNPIWLNNATLLPAIVALAIFFDRVIESDGRSTANMEVRKNEKALFGYEFVNVYLNSSALTNQNCKTVENFEKHWCTLITSATSFFLNDFSMMDLAVRYLETEANKDKYNHMFNAECVGNQESCITIVK